MLCHPVQGSWRMFSTSMLKCRASRCRDVRFGLGACPSKQASAVPTPLAPRRLRHLSGHKGSNPMECSPLKKAAFAHKDAVRTENPKAPFLL